MKKFRVRNQYHNEKLFIEQKKILKFTYSFKIEFFIKHQSFFPQQNDIEFLSPRMLCSLSYMYCITSNFQPYRPKSLLLKLKGQTEYITNLHSSSVYCLLKILHTNKKPLILTNFTNCWLAVFLLKTLHMGWLLNGIFAQRIPKRK